MKISVVKIGGKVIDNEALLNESLAEFSKTEGAKVLVHGGGKKATEVSEALGVESLMLEGRRITSKESLEVVTMVYGGLINKQIVANLQKYGCNALGLTGADMNVISATKRLNGTIDYGYVGDISVENVNIEIMESMLEQGITPVFSALTHDQNGSMLNTNADTIASTLAAALSKNHDVTLQYLFEKEGVLEYDTIINQLDAQLYSLLKENSIISDGMIPKIDNAFSALHSGVQHVMIGQTKIVTEHKKFKIDDPVGLLKALISTPSFSKQENKTADLVAVYLEGKGVEVKRSGNNVWALNKHFNEGKPTVLLNSHHDTVLPNQGYTNDPFDPSVKGGKLYGLGSNDAGGSLVALLDIFLQFYHAENLNYNLVFAATAEEEISGKNGIESILNKLPAIEFAIVGEPTEMKMAIAEKGLLVLDCIQHGISGHAANNIGVNAIHKAIKCIQWFETFEFQKISPKLGAVKMTVTQIEAGSQHNMIPDQCRFTVDIRVTDEYCHEDILKIVKANVDCKVTPRSTRLRASGIDPEHVIVKLAIETGLEMYGSPTLSDQALIPFPSVKIGPGKSERSHTADEFIYLKEIEEGIRIYKEILSKILLK